MVFFYYPLRTFLVSLMGLQDLTMKAGRKREQFLVIFWSFFLTHDMCAEVID